MSNAFKVAHSPLTFLVLGATGLLGKALVKEIKKNNFSCIGIARTGADINFDILNSQLLKSCLLDIRPNVVINACAIVNLDLCEKNPAIAYQINSRPSSIISSLASELDYKYIYVSTDGYFDDGNQIHDEHAKVVLFNEYARTKYLGECLSLLDEKSMVVRTNIIGFRGDKSRLTFIEWLLDKLIKKEKIVLFNDYFTSSISVSLFSKALIDLILKDFSGVINLASREVFSKKQFIEEFSNQFFLPIENYTVGSVLSLTGARRARYLGLDVSFAEQILGYKLPTLKEVVASLKEEYQHV